MPLSGAKKTLSIISERIKWKQSLPDADVLELPFQNWENPRDGFGEVSTTVFIQKFPCWVLILSLSFMTINIVRLCINLSIYKSFCSDFRGWMTGNMKGGWCLCVQMSGFLHARRRPCLSVCINELAVMFDHQAYHSHFQDLISKAGQSCPWEVSFAFLIDALIRLGGHIVFVPCVVAHFCVFDRYI